MPATRAGLSCNLSAFRNHTMERAVLPPETVVIARDRTSSAPAGSFDRGLYRDARRGLTLARLAGCWRDEQANARRGTQSIHRTHGVVVCLHESVHGTLVYMFRFVRMSRDDERTDANSSSQI